MHQAGLNSERVCEENLVSRGKKAPGCFAGQTVTPIDLLRQACRLRLDRLEAIVLTAIEQIVGHGASSLGGSSSDRLEVKRLTTVEQLHNDRSLFV